MAERLTDKNGVDFTPECSKVNPLLTQGRCPFYDKLGNLEDILEKYDLEVEELDERIYNGAFNYIYKLKAETERDTWKRACELACSKLVDYEWDNKESTHSAQYWLDYFYQQAKKEGE